MKSQARLRLRQPTEPVAAMLTVAGKPFRCECGANVFTKRANLLGGGDTFRCNGCGLVYA